MRKVFTLNPTTRGWWEDSEASLFGLPALGRVGGAPDGN